MCVVCVCVRVCVLAAQQPPYTLKIDQHPPVHLSVAACSPSATLCRDGPVASDPRERAGYVIVAALFPPWGRAVVVVLCPKFCGVCWFCIPFWFANKNTQRSSSLLCREAQSPLWVDQIRRKLVCFEALCNWRRAAQLRTCGDAFYCAWCECQVGFVAALGCCVSGVAVVDSVPAISQHSGFWGMLCVPVQSYHMHRPTCAPF